MEVNLCGHATLGAAHALWATDRVDEAEPIEFHTLSGVLRATRLDGGWIELDFPSDPPVQDEDPALLAALAAGLGVPVEAAWRGCFDVVAVVEPEAFGRIEPNQAALARIECRGIVATAAGALAGAPQGTHFVSRFFGPRAGIPEDPVTGSAHCTLVPLWAARLPQPPPPGAPLLAYQASARGGSLRCHLEGERVRLQGQACIVLRGSVVAKVQI